jgi:hypothetical protein
VSVVLTAKVQPGARITGIPGVEIARRAAISSVMRATGEPAAAQQLMIIGLMRQVYRVARERNRHIRHETQAAHRGGQGQRGEDVVRSFEGGNAARADIAQLTRTLDGIGEPMDGGEDFNGVSVRNARNAVD